MYRTPSKRAVAVLFLLARRDSAHGASSDHRYHIGEPVDLWVNTVGPYSNPQETYEYYSLPYCAPLIKFSPRTNQSCFNERKTLTIGEQISGYAFCDSGYAITFRSRYKSETCQTNPLTIEESQKLAYAVRRRWFYQMYVDDLPVWGMVGELLPGVNSPLANREDNIISDSSIRIHESHFDNILQWRPNCQGRLGERPQLVTGSETWSHTQLRVSLPVGSYNSDF